MNVFDIIGPVMVGPSSSHTAGAVRIGKATRELLQEEPVDVTVMLHGSFARTYKGHGTDRAIIAGLLGMPPDDLRIRESLKLASEKGMKYKFEEIQLNDAHPNTALIKAAGRSGKMVKVLGVSTGGGNISVKQINGLEVDFTGQYNTLVLNHQDAPGTIAAVTGRLAQAGVNIAQMKVYRTHRGGDAIMIIETDYLVEKGLQSAIERLPGIYGAIAIEPL
jgi:L-serine dehydratase